MSAELEKSESKTRVLRSMRRINSSDSLNLENDRPETPTGRLKAVKKLESIDEKAPTPTRRTRAGSAQRSLMTEETTTPASPLRRVTRRMSTENNLTTSVSSPARLTRASSKKNLVDSEDDEIVFVGETMLTPRTKSTLRRVSVSVKKLEEVLEEEQPEIETIENTKETADENMTNLNKSNDSTNELLQLELRNRSISKSPNVSQRNSGINLITLDEESKDSSMNSEISNTASMKKESSPSKSPKKKTPATNLPNVLNGSGSESSSKDESKLQRKSSRISQVINVSIAQTISSDSEKINANNTESAIKPPKAVKEAQIEENISPSKKSMDKVPTPQRKSKTFIDASNSSLISRDSGFSVKDAEVSISAQAETTNGQKENTEDVILKMMEDFVATSNEEESKQKQLQLTKMSSLNNKTQFNSVDMTIDSDDESSPQDATNKQIIDMDITSGVDSSVKNSTNTWNQSIRGSGKQIDAMKLPETQVIQDKTIRVPQRTISSDESDDDGKFDNPFVDYEAEEVESIGDTVVGSFTESELLEMERNNISEHGESIGSQDSEEFGEEEENFENESFIDDGEISDTYSMDSADKLIEEMNESKPSRRSRIIAKFSSSEDEQQTQLTEKTKINSIISGLDGQSPAKTQMSAKKSRESLVIVAESSQSPAKTQMSAKKSRESLISDKDNQSPEKTQISVKKSKESLIIAAESSQSPAKTQMSARRSNDSLIKAAESSQSPIKSQLSAKKIKSTTSEQFLSTSPINKAQKQQGLDDSQGTTQKSSRQSLPNIQENAETEQLKKKSRKSLPNIPSLPEKESDGDESPLKTQKQPEMKKDRKSLPNAENSLNSRSVLIEKVEIIRKSLQNSTNDENMSSDLSETQNESVDKTETSAKESSQDDKRMSRKRQRETVNEDVKTSKRFKEMSPNESEACHMDDLTDLLETEVSNKEIKRKKKKKEIAMEIDEDSDSSEVKQSAKVGARKKGVNFNAILERCNEYMGKSKEEKKAKMVLKKEKKAKKLEKKQKEKDENPVQENLDSSNGENKENSIKKKKNKNKHKKKKLLDDIPDDKKNDMAEKMDQLEQKLELKRQRKKEKKLAKLNAEQSEEVAEPATEKKSKQIPAEEAKPSKKGKEAVEAQEIVVETEKPKKKKSQKNLETAVEDVPVENIDKKKKKSKLVMEVDEAVPQKVKVKKAKKTVEVTSIAEPMTAEHVNEKAPIKKAKKRPIAEVVEDIDDEIVEKPISKKKLKILSQVEDPWQASGSQKKPTEQKKNQFKASATLTSKLNQIIPKGLGNDEKQVVKKKKKVVAVEKKELKRPVWTSAGTFIEEAVSPYSFKSTEYKPFNIGSSGTTNYGVVAFSAKQKSAAPNRVDYKMQQLMRHNKNRDKSIKNLKNLM